MLTINAKKKCFVLVFILLSLGTKGTVHAQYYNFESSAVPAAWIAGQGELAINEEHYKEGSRSLQWKTAGQSQLNISLESSYTTTAKSSIYFQLYSSEITNDLLEVELFNSSNVLLRTMTIKINFKGWREICRYYTEFSSSINVTVSHLHFTIKPSDINVQRTLYVDDVNFNMSKPTLRLIGNHWVEDADYFPEEDKVNLLFYNYPVDIPETTPNEEELSALTNLKTISALQLTPKAGNATELSQAKLYAESMNIIRNSDGSVRGNPVSLRSTDLTEDIMLQTTRYLEVLAADVTSAVLFNNLLDHLLDQGFAEGLPFEVQSNSYTAARDIPSSLFKILPKCNERQKEEVLKLCKWLVQYGHIYLPEDIYMYNLNADIVYNYSVHFMRMALNQPTALKAIRELKAFKRLYDRYATYTPADFDMLKPDGTGFHHGTHYNSYMYAYTTYASYLFYLRNTPFQIELASYNRFRKAFISYYLMMPCATDDNRYMPFSLCGRKPGSLKASIKSTGFANMIAAGDALYGTVDNEARAAYNYFFKTNTYSTTTPIEYNGFYAFNYSPLGVYRGNGWVATMRSPTTKFWGTEIYENTNRFGRYQAHGSLEVMYDGDLTKSGYPELEESGGWDWNIVPGTTNVHFTSWREMMPVKNTTARFAQYAVSKNFAGALAWGKIGLFAADFDQSDMWGSQRFTPTNLTFKKSVLAVDELLISIGSEINTSGDYSSNMKTATNLFQSVIYSDSQPLSVNGTLVSSTYNTTLDANHQHTLISPTGTGYIIPQGNDALEVVYGIQTAPIHTGSDVDSPGTSLTVAKAFLNHGVKTNGKSYQMVVVPAATPQSLTKYAAQVTNDSLYEVLSSNSRLHSIYYKPKGIMTYSCFEPQQDISIGLLRATTAEGLLMYRENIDIENAVDFAVVNPSLRPEGEGANFSWVEKTTTMIITIAGKWSVQFMVQGVEVLSADDTQTQIQIELEPGMPRYFTLLESIVPKYFVQLGTTGAATWDEDVVTSNSGTLVDLVNEGKSLSAWYNATFTTTAAANGYNIYIIKGNYEFDTRIVYQSNIRLYGGYVGTKLTRDKGTNSWDFTNETIFDGNNNTVQLIYGGGIRSNVIFDGFTLQNGGGGAAVILRGSEIVRNCKLINNINNATAGVGAAMYLYGGGNVYNCYFEGNKNNGATGYGGDIATTGTGTRAIDGNMFVNSYALNKAAVLSISGGSTVTFSNNIIREATGSAAIVITSTVASKPTVNIINNTFVNNTVQSIYIDGVTNGYPYLKIYNCVFWAPSTLVGGLGKAGGAADANTIIKNCALMEAHPVSWTSANNFLLQGTNSGETPDAKYPAFVNPVNNDFRITAASALRNTGATFADVVNLKDFFGTERPLGSNPEIGYYELVETETATNIKTTINNRTTNSNVFSIKSYVHNESLVIENTDKTNTQVEVFHIMGKLIIKKQMSMGEVLLIPLSKGIYVIKITNDNNIRIIKTIIP